MQYAMEVSGEDFSQMCMASDMRSFGWGKQDEELNFQFSLFLHGVTLGLKRDSDIESSPWISKTFLVFETDHWRLDQMRWGINLLISF